MFFFYSFRDFELRPTRPTMMMLMMMMEKSMRSVANNARYLFVISELNNLPRAINATINFMPVKKGPHIPYSKFEIHKLRLTISCMACNFMIDLCQNYVCNVTRSSRETDNQNGKRERLNLQGKKGCEWAEARLNALNEIIKQVEDWCKGEAAKSMRTYAPILAAHISDRGASHLLWICKIGCQYFMVLFYTRIAHIRNEKLI